MFYVKYQKVQKVLGKFMAVKSVKPFENRSDRDAFYRKIETKNDYLNIKKWDEVDNKTVIVKDIFCGDQGVKLNLHFDKWYWARAIASSFHNDIDFEKFYGKKCKHGMYIATIPNQTISIDKIKSDTSYNFENDAALNAHYEYLKAREKTTAFLQTNDNLGKYNPTNPELANNFDELRPYQLAGVRLLQQYKSFGLFWEQRTGKTPTTIIGTLQYKKIIIGVPSGHQLNWKTEYGIWSHRQDIKVLPQSIKRRQQTYEDFFASESMILIGSYTTLAKDNEVIKKTIKKFDMLIIDEAHFLRSRRSQRSKGIQKLRALSKYGIALTGTPATNATSDVVNLLRFIDPKKNFINNFMNSVYFRPFMNYHSGYYEYKEVRPEAEKMWIQMLNTYSYNIKLHNVIPHIPKTIFEKIIIPSEPSQAKVIKEIVEKFRYFDKNGECKRTQNILTRGILLSQATLDPAILNINATSNKTKWLKNYLESEDESAGNKIIIWSSSKKYLTHLKNNVFKDALLFTGELTPKQKHTISEKFRNSKKIVMLANIQAGSMGWTWPCDTMIFVNRDWNPTYNLQANARGIEPNKINAKPLLIIDLQGDDGFDKRVELLNLGKITLSEFANNPNDYI